MKPKKKWKKNNRKLIINKVEMKQKINKLISNKGKMKKI